MFGILLQYSYGQGSQETNKVFPVVFKPDLNRMWPWQDQVLCWQTETLLMWLVWVTWVCLQWGCVQHQPSHSSLATWASGYVGPSLFLCAMRMILVSVFWSFCNGSSNVYKKLDPIIYHVIQSFYTDYINTHKWFCVQNQCCRWVIFEDLLPRMGTIINKIPVHSCFKSKSVHCHHPFFLRG